MIDLHCHLLPGIDDGSPDWETTEAMCRTAAEDGITRVVASPHYFEETYENSASMVSTLTAELRQRFTGHPPLLFFEGADVHMTHDLPRKIQDGIIPTINGTPYLLLELPTHVIPPAARSIVFDLLVQGFRPILTHPERNVVIQRDVNILYEFLRLGALCQITAMSLTGGFGKGAQVCAQRLLGCHMVHAIATDAHGVDWRPPVLSPGVEAASKVCGAEMAECLVSRFPQQILDGVPVDGPPPEPLRKKWFVWR